jgi:hypothetical protein
LMGWAALYLTERELDEWWGTRITWHSHGENLCVFNTLPLMHEGANGLQSPVASEQI